jgi:uncharacterized protein
MRQYERNGVYVDQCSECRGIFLDRGELERLIEAEARWSTGVPSRRPGYESGRYDDDHDEDDDWDEDGRRRQHVDGHHKPHHHKRKKSFLEGLFDD